MRFVDIYWLVAPAHYGEHFHFSWITIVAFLGIGGIWLCGVHPAAQGTDHHSDSRDLGRRGHSRGSAAEERSAMPEHIQYEDDDLFNPETHHEESDVPVRPLLWALGHLRRLRRRHALRSLLHVQGASSKTRAGSAWTRRRRRSPVPPTPTFRRTSRSCSRSRRRRRRAAARSTPVTDLTDMRAAEEKVLQNYGWVDKQHGVVHIPIDQAKRDVRRHASSAERRRPRRLARRRPRRRPGPPCLADGNDRHRH